MFAIAASTVTSWGLYVLLPIFIAFLFFIMDIFGTRGRLCRLYTEDSHGSRFQKMADVNGHFLCVDYAANTYSA